LSREPASGGLRQRRDPQQAESRDDHSAGARPRPPDRCLGAREAGQGIVEYGLILAIMIVVCIAALVFFGDQLAAILGFIASKV
jgi:Flp pilus assembly pilin Flp